MKNKKILISILTVIIISLIVGGIILYVKVLKPKNEAIEKYNNVVKIINEKNKELDGKIEKINNLIDSDEKVIDESIINDAKDITKKAINEKFIVNEMPSSTDEILKETEELSTPPDYSEIYTELENMYIAYENTIKQYKQLTNPNEEFILQRLQAIDEISDARAVTEDNDPNGNLNKPGGYTATVYFESKNINQTKVYGKDLIDKGTDAGGAIEVYANEEDAKKRENYLASFDGSVLASGSHRIIGTVLIRTSDKLTASQQKSLEQKIVNSLVELK